MGNINISHAALQWSTTNTYMYNSHLFISLCLFILQAHVSTSSQKRSPFYVCLCVEIQKKVILIFKFVLWFSFVVNLIWLLTALCCTCRVIRKWLIQCIPDTSSKHHHVLRCVLTAQWKQINEHSNGFNPLWSHSHWNWIERWSQSTSQCGLNADSNRFQNNSVGGNIVSHNWKCVACQNYYKLSICAFAMADGWTAEMTCPLISVWCQGIIFRVSRTEWFGIERYSREYL